ncbi:hypothetical protein AR158_C322R [Paramecium bursaria Chlorella virus AR158]|uniref:hypothetical protein n=1 Tax=Paramecium bursaria Chlorella virus AR158 TaxID=380598 RepID=UPI00015AA926|nr:hypothetical protein AR158_C322R [Paramecium bursaria Chlorella virus AR158]ABU43867.1 hypothetical protein AR158_C322R [Paramecium bursaria Chlorella virus AR158]
MCAILCVSKDFAVFSIYFSWWSKFLTIYFSSRFYIIICVSVTNSTFKLTFLDWWCRFFARHWGWGSTRHWGW